MPIPNNQILEGLDIFVLVLGPTDPDRLPIEKVVFLRKFCNSRIILENWNSQIGYVQIPGHVIVNSERIRCINVIEHIDHGVTTIE